MTWQAVSRQLTAMPSELYLVRLIHAQSGRAFPGERLWSAAQLVKVQLPSGFCAPAIVRDAIFISTPTLGTKTQAISRRGPRRPAAPWFWRPCDPMGMLPVWSCRLAPATFRPGFVSVPVRCHLRWRPLRGQVVSAMPMAATSASTDWRHLGRFRRFSPIRSPRAALRADKLLGQTAVRPCGPRATSRLLLQSAQASVQPRPLARPISTPLFPATRLLFQHPRHRAGQRHLPRLYAALEDRRPLSATRLEHRRSGWVARLLSQGTPAPRVETHLSARQPRISPAVTIAQTTTCTAPSRGLLFPPQGRAVLTTSAPLPHSLPATALLAIQLTESIQRQSANAVRHPIRTLHIGMDLLVSDKV